jgi:hypothetical protein
MGHWAYFAVMHAVPVRVSVVRTVNTVGAEGALAKAAARDFTDFLEELLTGAALFSVRQVWADADARYRSHHIVDDEPLASR